MKIIVKCLIIFGFLILSGHEIIGQNEESKLDQVKLMKQFIGSWRGNLGNTMSIISDNNNFANGLLCTSEIFKDGKSIESVVQLFGYDEKADKFIIAELKESKPVIEICSAWFITPTKGVIIITNPENAPYSFKFEFQSPDRIMQHAIIDGNIVNEITLFRENTDEK